MKKWIEKYFLFLRKTYSTDSKAQSAMEFLMTYGWAILVVLIAIGALAYFGVLSPDNFLPEACLMAPGLDCLDFKIETSRITLILQNNLGNDIIISEVKVTENNGNECLTNVPLLLEDNEKILVSILGCDNGVVGEKFKGNIDVSYSKVNVDYTLNRIAKGTVAGKVIAVSAVTSFNICQNAETGGLCPGLDVLFGTGYQAACCSEHVLCC